MLPYKNASAVLTEEQVLEVKTLLIKNKAGDIIQKDQGDDTTYIEHLFHPLYNTLRSYRGLADIRLYAVDAFGVWLLRSVQVKALPGAPASLEANLSKLMSDEVASFFFDYVVDFWNESGSPLSNALRDLLTKLVAFVSLFRPGLALFTSWTLQVLQNIPHSKRVFYFIIQTLLKHIDCSIILQKSPRFIEDSLAQMYSHAFANSVAKCVAAVLGRLYTDLENEEEWLQLWTGPTVRSLTNFDLCKNTQIYLLPLVFKIPKQPRPVYKHFLNELLQTTNPNALPEDAAETFRLLLYLGCLKIGVDLQIDEAPFEGQDPLIQKDTLRLLLFHEHKTIRITAYSIFVSSTKKAKPVQPQVYQTVLDVLDVYFVDDDPDARNDFFSLTRNFILRVRDSTHVAAKNLRGLVERGLDINNSALEQQIDEGKQFAEALLKRAKEQISPGGTYQRLHLAFSLITALVCAGVDSRVGKKYLDRRTVAFPFSVDVYTVDTVRLLIDNIVNNFDDIRQFSVKLLEMAPTPLAGLGSEGSVDRLFRKSMEILKNIQGKQSDSGARLLQFVFNYNVSQGRNEENEKIIDYLLDCLEEGLKIAHEDMKSAVSQHPVHGFYKGLSVVIENYSFKSLGLLDSVWQARVERLLDLVHDNWSLTKGILANDSPEGNVPEEIFDEYGGIFSPFLQIISNYAWRAVKDSSAVLRHLLVKASPTILPPTQVLRISLLVLEQLSSVNHKGAFYLIYPTFEECCHRCYRKGLGLESEPEKWLAHNLGLIKSKLTYIIRRSAGLPFLILIVLVAEVRRAGKKTSVRLKNTPLFQKTFAELLAAARAPVDEEAYNLLDNIELPQVHAYNCLKQLFIEANLSEVSAFYVDQGLELSFKGLQSGVWAIRNCAVMLFAALENKLFGSQKVGDIIKPFSARLFFSRFKKMRRILLDNFEDFLKSEQKSGSSGSALESIFPILTILSRLEPTTDFENVLSDFSPFLNQSLGLKYGKIREMSAKALPSMYYEHELYEKCEELVSTIDVKMSSNKLHGVFLAVKEFLEKQERISSPPRPVPQSLVKKLAGLFKTVFQDHRVPMACKVYVDCLEIVVRINRTVSEFQELSMLLGNYFLRADERFEKLKVFNGAEQLLNESVVSFLLKQYLTTGDSELVADLLEMALVSSFYRVRLVGHCFFEAHLDSLIKTLPREAISEFQRMIWNTLGSSEASFIKAAALNLLRTLTSLNQSELDGYVQKLETLFSYLGKDNCEDVKAAALQATGPFVGHLVKDGSLDLCHQWLTYVEENADDDKMMDLRYSACRSLVSMLELVGDDDYSEERAYIIAKATFILYFQLSDNSEAVRMHAASFFCRKLRVRLTLPDEIERLFLLDFVRTKCAATVLLEYFASRPLFEAMVTKYLDMGKVLFDEEKSNLYRIDWVHHSQICEAAERMKLDTGSLALRFEEDWSALIRVVESKAADGFLGWSSHQEIYNAMRVVLANRKVAGWTSDDKKVKLYSSLVKKYDLYLSLDV